MTTALLIWGILFALIAPPALLVLCLRVYPRRSAIWLVGAPVVLSFGVLLTTHLTWLITIAVVDAFVLLLMLVDLTSLPSKQRFRAERKTQRIASLGKRQKVTVTFINESSHSVRVTMKDDVPPHFNAKPETFREQVVPPRAKWTIEYSIRPTQRGAFTLDEVHLSVRSLFGLWRRLIDCPCETTLSVYPDMRQLSEYALLAKTNRLSQMGLRRIRRVGQDHDFERLRDYTRDDNFKNIDWRVTARRQKLTVKDFQSSRSQRIMFLVDTGRMMANQADGLSLLDHSLNAMLMLSYIALSQQDAVGLMCFSDRIHNFVPPKAGKRQMSHLLHACHDRFPQLTESRYDEAFRFLASHCRKRSLVILITNVIDQVNSSQVEQYLTNIVGRHLPLGVLLRDHHIFDAFDVPQHDVTATEPRQFWRSAAAAEILAWRTQVLADLASKGAMTLDVFPEAMTAPLINQYLEAKARHLL